MSGLDGLGIINTKNDSATITGPLETAVPVNKDNRLLETNGAMFTDTIAFKEYLKNWFMQTGVINETDEGGIMGVGSQPEQIDTTVPYIRTGLCNESYTVVCGLTLENSRKIIRNIKALARPDEKIVIIAYCNFETEDKQLAESNGIELIGTSEIYEINSAINSSVAYLAVGKTFCYKLAKELNKRYKGNNSNAVMSDTKDTFGDIGSSLKDAFKEGFNQLKDSIIAATGFAKGAIKDPSILNTEQPEQFNNNGNVVDITKNEPPMDLPEMGIKLTPGTLNGEYHEPTPLECGEDIVTEGTASKEVIVSNELQAQAEQFNQTMASISPVENTMNNGGFEQPVVGVSFDKGVNKNQLNNQTISTVSLEKPVESQSVSLEKPVESNGTQIGECVYPESQDQVCQGVSLEKAENKYDTDGVTFDNNNNQYETQGVSLDKTNGVNLHK